MKKFQVVIVDSVNGSFTKTFSAFSIEDAIRQAYATMSASSYHGTVSSVTATSL